MRFVASLLAASAALIAAAPASAALSFNFVVTQSTIAGLDVGEVLAARTPATLSFNSTAEQVRGDLFFYSEGFSLVIRDGFVSQFGTPAQIDLRSQMFSGDGLTFRYAADGIISEAVFRRGDQSASLSASAVPEPATWAMLIAGFGLMGTALRRRAHRVGVATSL